MKSLVLIMFAVGLTAVFAYPHQDSHNSDCELRNILERIRRPVVGQDGLPIKDSLSETSFKNVSITLNKKYLSGKFALINGVDKKTHPSLDYNYDPINQKLYFNSTVKESSFSGLYEIVDGQMNIPNLGQHNFSGKGYLNSSAFDVVVSIAVGIEVDPKSDQLSLADLKFDYDFSKVSIIAKNLVVDGIPVEWEMVNKNIRSAFDKIWTAAHDYMVNFSRESLTEALQGCKLSDLESP